ncbi:LacI family DNA-binding transcriptional regulator [Woeseia oceani]|nr:LacI family DNA-binding transcriptional regulator [Woeseia oceani]
MVKKKMSSRVNRRVTLRDIAEATNVSVMTVSNVVNGKSQFVSSATRQKVDAAIKKLKYVPSATSRKLRSSQEFSIGMIIMDEAPVFLADPFIGQLVAGLSNHLSTNNYSLTVQGVRPESFQRASLFSVAGTDALCAILCGPKAERRKNVDFMLGRHQPVVIFQDSLDIKASGIAIVNQDDEKGGYEITSHVISRGAKKLLFVRPLVQWPAIEKRLKGVKKAIARKKGVTLEILKCEESTFEKTQEALAEYLAVTKVPDAILGGTDAMAIAAMRYCQDQGYKVPEDIMVTGFNGFSASSYSTPSLTTIVSPAYEMGQLAGQLILDRLRTGRFSARKTLLPVSFKQGGSA